MRLAGRINAMPLFPTGLCFVVGMDGWFLRLCLGVPSGLVDGRVVR